MKKKIVMMAAMLVVLGWSAPTGATLVEIGITAKVWQVDDRANLLEGKIQVDDIITGIYRYDSETPNTSTESNAGLYMHYSMPYGIEIYGGGYTFKTDPDNVEFKVAIGNNYYSKDYYIINSRNNVNLSNGIGVEMISWQLEDDTMTAISNTILPVTPPNLDIWDSISGLEITGEKVGSNYDTFRISSNVISAVPEPSMMALFLLGAILTKRRFRNKVVK